MIHGKTRNKDLIDILFQLGLSVSYDRVLSISTDLANAIIDNFENDSVVCPPALRSALFTVSALDNFDHNPSSTSAKSATHGTSISLFQEHTAENPGTERPKASMPLRSSKVIKQLPDNYAIVPASALQRKNPKISPTTGPGRSDGQLIASAMEDESRYILLYVYISIMYSTDHNHMKP